tara:strand:- start:388 stop:1467 length:1080 start_codon:yes stop_codon:yes gene_type:complete
MNEITFSRLSEQEQPKLLEAISEIYDETEAHDSDGSSSLSWNWQYKDLPLKDSYIYIAKLEKKIIGYYHIPAYELEIKNNIYKIGHIQSVAILKKYRGENVFQGLAQYANEDVNKFLDVIYTFPNDKSIHTFTKYNNFSLVAPLPVYILPINTNNLISSKFKLLGKLKILWSLFDFLFNLIIKTRLSNDEVIEKVNKITPEIEKLISEFHNKNTINLFRNQNYLNWRYLNYPKRKYEIFTLRKNSILKSLVVVKKENIFSVNGLIVMDFVFDRPKDLQKLLSNLSKIMDFDNKDETSFVFLSAISMGLNKLKYSGFIRVPQVFVPRKLNLLVRWTREEITDELEKPESWFVSLGDWDVF